MIKKDFTLERSCNKRVCKCGGELELIGIDYDFRPHTRCIKCGIKHIGIDGTKKVSND